ncbi:MAG: UDP-glucose/GDP-mannose dehydrogenase family protein [Actinomycetota bacterium]
MATMRIAVVGTGHVGLTTAACLAHLGHEVLGVDDDAEKISIIARGEVPFHEPGLAELVREGLDTGRLRVSSETHEAARYGDVVFISVNTPTRPSGEANLAQVEQVARTIARNLDGYTVVVEKSTVPVETGVWIQRTISRMADPRAEFDVASNPEFLREGKAVHDTLEPDRIVVGSSSPRAIERLREVYRPILDGTKCPFVVTDLATAELIKHASNAFLATKISFVNQLADVCERTGADVETVASAMGLDPRIGASFLRAGVGYGGACLPKDVQAFRYKAGELGVDFEILDAVDAVNRSRIDGFLEKIRSVIWNFEDKKVAIWGLAFKPDTDDLRNAPAVRVAEELMAAGARVSVHDPVAMSAAKSMIPDASFEHSPLDAAREADCVVICTEWQEYATTDLTRLREVMTNPVVVDGRNIFRPADMQDAGFVYASVGRPTVWGTPAL